MLVDNMLAPTGRCGIKPDHKYDKLNLLFMLDIWISPNWTDKQTVGQVDRLLDTGLGSHNSI